MKLSFLSGKKTDIVSEATVTWVGPLHNTLGDGSDYTVNFGSSDRSRPPLLYIQIPLYLVNSAMRHVSRGSLIWAAQDQTTGRLERVSGRDQAKALVKKILQADPTAEVYPFPRLDNVGESHISITMGQELAGALQRLRQQGGFSTDADALRSLKIDGVPLFAEDGRGLSSKIAIVEPAFSVFRAAYYKDEVDATGPMLVALNVETDMYTKVRVALGLSPTFKLPGSNFAYKQHVTLGYIPKKNLIRKSFLELDKSN
jgi:hypothetical protein